MSHENGHSPTAERIEDCPVLFRRRQVFRDERLREHRKMRGRSNGSGVSWNRAPALVVLKPRDDFGQFFDSLNRDTSSGQLFRLHDSEWQPQPMKDVAENEDIVPKLVVGSCEGDDVIGNQRRDGLGIEPSRCEDPVVTRFEF